MLYSSSAPVSDRHASGIFITSGVPALCMQAARHSQSIENTVFIFGNRGSPSEK